jgi:hypothetical protein
MPNLRISELSVLASGSVPISGASLVIAVSGTTTQQISLIDLFSVSGFLYQSGIVRSGQISSGQVGFGHLANGAVQSGTLASGQVFTFHVASGGLLSGAFGSGQIAQDHLGSGAVRSGAVASGQIGFRHLANGAVQSGSIASGQVSDMHLAANAVRSGHLAVTEAPDGTKFLRDDFTWQATAGGALTSGAVQSGHIASGTVQGFFGTTRHVASGTIGVFDFGSGAITAGTVGSGAIRSGNVASGQLGLNHLSITEAPDGTKFLRDDFSWQATAGGALTSGSVQSGHVASGAIQGFFGTTPHIASGTLGTFDFGSGAIIAGAVGSGAVRSGNIASGGVGFGHIANAAVRSGSVASGQLFDFHFASGAKIDSAQRLWDNFNFIAGERISGGVEPAAVCIGTISGAPTILTAMASVSGRMPAIGVVIANVASGATATVYKHGPLYGTNISLSGYQGRALFVDRSGRLNASGAPTLSGDVVQCVGYVLQNSGMFLDMGDAFEGLIKSGDVGSGAIGGQGAGGYFNIASGSVARNDLGSGILPASLQFVIDGGGAALASGHFGFLQIPFNCSLTSVALYGDRTGASGETVFPGIWKDTHANFPPTSGDTIAPSGVPLISGGSSKQLYSGTGALAGWTTTFTGGDVLSFNVHSGSLLSRVTVALRVLATGGD